MNKQFLEENINLVYYLADRIGNKLSREDKEDLVQEVCYRVLASETRALQEQASAYVSNIMKNTMLNMVRDRNRDAMGNVDSLSAPANDEDGTRVTKADLLHAKDASDYKSPPELYKSEVDTLLNYLPPRLGKIFYKRFYLSMSIEELMKEEGVSLSFMNRLISKVKARARRLVIKIPEARGTYEGMNLREMCLVSLPDKLLIPFKLRYVNEKSLIDISKLSGRGINEIEQDLLAGARIIQQEYGVHVLQR